MALAFKTLRLYVCRRFFAQLRHKNALSKWHVFALSFERVYECKNKHHMHKIRHYLLKCTSYLKALGYAASVNLTSSYS